MHGSTAGQLDSRARAWLRARARVAPGAIRRQQSLLAGCFEHAWSPVQLLARQVRHLPPALWDALLSLESGFVVLVAGPSRYVEGATQFRRQQLRNVAFVSLRDVVDADWHAGSPERADVVQETWAALHVIGHLIDHHLGCGGEDHGAWLSEGGGSSIALVAAGQRLRPLFELGYGIDEVAQANVRDYFAQSLAAYCRDRQRLTAVDPQIAKWFRSTLWNPALWR